MSNKFPWAFIPLSRICMAVLFDLFSFYGWYNKLTFGLFHFYLVLLVFIGIFFFLPILNIINVKKKKLKMERCKR